MTKTRRNSEQIKTAQSPKGKTATKCNHTQSNQTKSEQYTEMKMNKITKKHDKMQTTKRNGTLNEYKRQHHTKTGKMQ